MEVEKTLGMTIKDSVLRVVDEKMRVATLASEALLVDEFCIPAQVDALLGLWTWIVLVARGGMSIPNRIYRWIRENRRKARARLPSRVKDELATLTGMSIFFEADLTRAWWPIAYMTDASWQGFGIVQTQATREELREAARGANHRGWLLSAEDQLAAFEEEQAPPQDLQQAELAEWREQRARRRAGQGFLKLFAGTATRNCTGRGPWTPP